MSRGRAPFLAAVLAASAACGFDATPAESPDPTARLPRIHIRQADLLPPHETPSAANPPRVVARPPGAKHQARVAAARRPDVLLRAHSAPLGIAFYTHEAFPPRFRGGAFVALHGSWNARGRRGYEVVFLPFEGGKARGWSERFLRGWALAPDRREVWGRPVGLLVDRDGSLLVSEDGQGTLWRVRHGEGG